MPGNGSVARAPVLLGIVLSVALAACGDDASPAPPAGVLAFGATCSSDEECASRACHQADGGISFCTVECEMYGDNSECLAYGQNWHCLYEGAALPECVCIWDSQLERCADGVDNNCNGVVDDGCSECSPACARGASCIEGTCVCPDGQVVCDGACVSLARDRNHCGGCGNLCSEEDAECMDGVCRCFEPGRVVCGRDCALLDSSTDHCGACGNACAIGATCERGACACPAGQVVCEGRCVDLSRDALACGACGHACLPGGTCEGGVCACSPERTLCSDECADLGSSERNCGACGSACEHLCLGAQCDEPVEVVGMWGHACARTASGRVACWGSNEEGAVGADTGTTPHVVDLPLPATALTAGSQFTCALLSDRTVWCWGSNSAGQLGHEVWDTEVHTPGPVVGLENAIAIAAGGSFACAIRDDRTVACWGSSWSGEIGTTDEVVVRPRTVPVSGAIAITGGYTHACALLSDRTVVCWGTNAAGELGRGTRTAFEVVGPVPGLHDVVSVDAGMHFTCAVTATGRAYCWGDNHHGQLGFAPTEPWTEVDIGSPTPVPVSSITTATSVVAATSHACLLLGDRTLRCMGPERELGSGLTSGSPAIATPPVADVDRFEANYYNTFALSGGTLWVWGMNQRGQLMLPPGEEHLTPVRASWTP